MLTAMFFTFKIDYVLETFQHAAGNKPVRVHHCLAATAHARLEGAMPKF